MFYRRKMILAILEVFGGKIARINLQKILFLVSQRQSKAAYDFIPYKFGCFSYSANADLLAMVKHGYLLEDDVNFQKKDKKSYLPELNAADRQLVNQAYILLKNHDADALMKYTYTKFPYYAINSVTAERLLTLEERNKVSEKRPLSTKTILYTIGYEGVSLETYLNKLIQHDVRVLVDVRNNPLSQKFGFSKSQLKNYCNSLSIEYVHYADVGIQSEERQELNVQKDYDDLFANYQRNVLPQTKDTQERILDLLRTKKRIALTCFEANICQCHRKYLSEAITTLPGWQFELNHI